MSTFGNFTVTRASTKNVLGSNGLLQSVANNVPAFEFNADGSYRGTLVEPGATNLALQSQTFDNASWSKTGAGTGLAPVVTANDAVAPDGTTTADLIVFNRGAGNTIADQSVFSQAPTVVNATAYTASFFLKAATGADVGKQIAIRAVGLAGYVTITLTADWVRYTRTETSTSTTGNIELASRGTVTTENTVSVHAWQAQLETGAVATSPIVTTGSTANRVADSVTLTGASSLIGQTEGTLYAEIVFPTLYDGGGAGPGGVEIGDGGNFVNILTMGVARDSPNNRIIAINRASNVNTIFVGFNVTAVGTYKCALGYSASGTSFYVNGSKVTSYTTGTSATATTISSFDRVTMGGAWNGSVAIGQTNNNYKAVALFPTRLSDSQLASLTTL
jgi:hypothetical protein